MTVVSSLGRTTALIAFCASAFAAPAPVRDVPDTYHGVTVHDPYRYMENVKDPQVQAWLKEQGGIARDALDRIEGRDAIQRRIDELSTSRGDAVRSIVRMPGDKLFFMMRPKGTRQYKLFVRDGGQDRMLMDPEVEARAKGVVHSIDWFKPAWDGEHVAFAMAAGGSEDSSLYVLNVKSGKVVNGPIPRVRQSVVSWLPDSKSFTYNQLRQLTAEDADTETYLDSKVMWLKVGAPESQAKAVFGPTVTKNLGLDRLDVGGLTFAPGSPWVIARTTDTTLPEGSLFVGKAADVEGGMVTWQRLSKFDDQIVEIELQGNDLYYRTKKAAPRYKLMRLDLRTPQLQRAVEVALPPQGGVLGNFVVGRHSLMATVRDGANIGLREYARGDRTGKPVPLPFKGAASVHNDPAHAHDDWLFTLAGWTQAPITYRLAQGKATEVKIGERPVLQGVPEIEVLDVKFPSHHGVQVPMTVLSRKGLKRDGTNPTLVDGYGSYGFSQTASFDPARIAWLERGGVLAYVNVRGSGVYGDAWRLAGFKQTKPNTWKDGIAAAQYLIAQGYASPKTMGIMGTSAGGIFVGRAVTSAPQLFAAAIFNVGVMDAVRAEESANGITNISEFGSYKNPQEFPALLEMSTYHQIRDGTPYPAVMLVHGLNDPRVDVWQSAKAAARLQAASTSGKPILLRLDAQAGHGVGSTATQRDSLRADIYAFLLWQMGKTSTK